MPISLWITFARISGCIYTTPEHAASRRSWPSTLLCFCGCCFVSSWLILTHRTTYQVRRGSWVVWLGRCEVTFHEMLTGIHARASISESTVFFLLNQLVKGQFPIKLNLARRSKFLWRFWRKSQPGEYLRHSLKHGLCITVRNVSQLGRN